MTSSRAVTTIRLGERWLTVFCFTATAMAGSGRRVVVVGEIPQEPAIGEGSPMDATCRDAAFDLFGRPPIGNTFVSSFLPFGKEQSMTMTPQAVLAMCRERDIKAVDLRFMDFPGIWQHFTIPVSKLEEEVFEEGLGFDGSSIRGWQAINESDMLLMPQPTRRLSIRSPRSRRCA